MVEEFIDTVDPGCSVQQLDYFALLSHTTEKLSRVDTTPNWRLSPLEVKSQRLVGVFMHLSP